MLCSVSPARGRKDLNKDFEDYCFNSRRVVRLILSEFHLTLSSVLDTYNFLNLYELIRNSVS